MKITGKISLLLTALAVALACAPVAKADIFTYAVSAIDVTYGNTPISGSLTFITTSLGGGYYGITGASGSLGPSVGTPDTIADTNLSYDWLNTAHYNTIYLTAALAAGINVNYDNILNLSGTGPFFDQYGLYITATNGDVLNLYNNPSNVSSFTHYGYNDNIYSVNDEDIGPFSMTPAPEPSTWMLLGSGLFTLAGLAWKSRTRNSSTAMC
jgi:hypothetical protein